MLFTYLVFQSPLGWIAVTGTADGIALVEFLGPAPDGISHQRVSALIRSTYPDAVPEPGDGRGGVGDARTHILDYLHKRKPIPDMPLDLRKGTVFDLCVWKAISGIPFGETRSYKQVAEAAGNAKCARAAGRACGRNPVPILIPCHRVVTSEGKLGGFSAGLDIKRALLGLERSTDRRTGQAA